MIENLFILLKLILKNQILIKILILLLYSIKKFNFWWIFWLVFNLNLTFIISNFIFKNQRNKNFIYDGPANPKTTIR